MLQDTTAEHVARERADRSARELDDWFVLSPFGMVLYDEAGLLVRTNPAFENLIGPLPVMLDEAPASLQHLLAWDDRAADGARPTPIPLLQPGGAPLVSQGWLTLADGNQRHLRATVRCYRTFDGEQRFMAVVEDRSAEEERDLAQVQIGALMDTAGVGLATFQESSGWVRQRIARQAGFGGWRRRRAAGRPADLGCAAVDQPRHRAARVDCPNTNGCSMRCAMPSRPRCAMRSATPNSAAAGC